MKKERSRLTLILILVIVVLVGLLLYLLVIRPAITGNVVRLRNEGYTYAIGAIMQQAAQCQPVPLTFGNQTVEVVSVDCVNQALQQQTQG